MTIAIKNLKINLYSYLKNTLKQYIKLKVFIFRLLHKFFFKANDSIYFCKTNSYVKFITISIYQNAIAISARAGTSKIFISLIIILSYILFKSNL